MNVKWEDILASSNQEKILCLQISKYNEWCKPNVYLTLNYTIPTLKHGGGSIMHWGHFTSSETVLLVKIEKVKHKAKAKQECCKTSCPDLIQSKIVVVFANCSQQTTSNHPEQPGANIP